jgi:sec-independent protein translocase protein TatC
VVIFVIAAIATPPDVISQLLLAIPLIILFEGSLLLMKPTAELAEGDAAEDGDVESSATP